MTLTVNQLLAEKSRLERVIADGATARADIRALDTFLNHFGVKVPAVPGVGHQGAPSTYKPGSFTCDVDGCGKTYTAKSSLDAHKGKVHSIVAVPLAPQDGHACDVCDRVFSTPQGLGSHRLRHHGVKGAGK